MGDAIVETIESMLVGVQEHVEDADASFKLRTARQMIILLGEQREAAQDALECVDLDQETRDRLRELGYLHAEPTRSSVGGT